MGKSWKNPRSMIIPRARILDQDVPRIFPGFNNNNFKILGYQDSLEKARISFIFCKKSRKNIKWTNHYYHKWPVKTFKQNKINTKLEISFKTVLKKNNKLQHYFKYKNSINYRCCIDAAVCIISSGPALSFAQWWTSLHTSHG